MSCKIIMLWCHGVMVCGVSHICRSVWLFSRSHTKHKPGMVQDVMMSWCGVMVLVWCHGVSVKQ